MIKSLGHVVLEPRYVPSNIMKPPYINDVNAQIPNSAVPEIKSITQIECMRASCSLARRTLKYAKELIKVKIDFSGIGNPTYQVRINVYCIAYIGHCRLELQLKKLIKVYMSLLFLKELTHHHCIIRAFQNLFAPQLTMLCAMVYPILKLNSYCVHQV